MASCLSAKKHHLVCDLGSLVGTSLPVVCHDFWLPHFEKDLGLLLWSPSGSDESSTNDEATTKNVFEEYTSRLAPHCHNIHKCILHLREPDVASKYAQNLEWTGNKQLFLDCLKMSQTEEDVPSSLSLLLSTAALERALGDVFLIKNDGPCPTMLKTLLATQELEQVFGQNVITLLRVLIGPPTSLNLRNLLWHGFVAPGEIPHRYSSFQVVVVASIGRILENHNIQPKDITHRPPLFLPQVEAEPFKKRFHELHDADMDILWSLWSNSSFFHKPMLPYCQTAIQYFKEGRYGLLCVLLLPQLENGVRKLFATANNCPQRILSSESEYFTTFDEMLCSQLACGDANALIPFIGESYMEMLLDFLVHPEGPRLRDHISHGELDLETVSKTTASHVMSICAAFCMRDFTVQDQFEVPLQRITQVAENYVSLYHPIQLLKGETSVYIQGLSKWVGLRRPTEDGYQTWMSEMERDTEERKFNLLYRSDNSCGLLGEVCKSSLEPFGELEPLLQYVCDLQIKTLFRPRRELEVTSLLRRIAAQCSDTSAHVVSIANIRYQQYVNKELRSRQRANYARLLNSIPHLSYGLRLIALTVAHQLQCLSSVTSLSDKKMRIHIKYLKAILQIAENLQSLTSPDKNRWDECCMLIESLQRQIRIV